MPTISNQFVDPNLELIQGQIGSAILDLATGEIYKSTGVLSDQSVATTTSIQTLHKILKVRQCQCDI